MTLKKRIDRLAKQLDRTDDEAPTVIFLCEANGEALAALLIGSDTLNREPGETEAAFIARASGGAPRVLSLPENGRDALATGEVPLWAQSELVMRALRAKHAPDK